MSPEEIDAKYEHNCPDCGRGVYAVNNRTTGFQHRRHRVGEPDWHCPRHPQAPFGVKR
jgi:hypothetical protein